MSIWRKKQSDAFAECKGIVEDYTNAGLSPAEAMYDGCRVTGKYNLNKGLAMGGIAAGIVGIIYGTVKNIQAERELARNDAALQAKIDYARAMRDRLDEARNENSED